MFKPIQSKGLRYERAKTEWKSRYYVELFSSLTPKNEHVMCIVYNETQIMTFSNSSSLIRHVRFLLQNKWNTLYELTWCGQIMYAFLTNCLKKKNFSSTSLSIRVQLCIKFQLCGRISFYNVSRIENIQNEFAPLYTVLKCTLLLFVKFVFF